jgi:N-acetylmuramoyl-L-alanine amidase
MATGNDLVTLALEHLGEPYVLGALAPKNDPRWQGPWDCAEFVSWCVYQVARKLYGCFDNQGDPALADAYTGYWARDANTLGKIISVNEAARIPGAAILRLGPKIGHIVLADGQGGTVEAHSSRTGVIRHTLSGRRWDLGILVPGIAYRPGNGPDNLTPPPFIFRLTRPYMQGEKVREIQRKLMERGFLQNGVDGLFGPQTFAAVLAFQRAEGLVTDGEVGPQTAAALGVSLS